ncbi:LuxR C-terminal-related transcriptional regulator [uncultured Roseovarius sp.]|uniref:LuxR C-terminal-related transcriptional regulator n=1 Tax=uncultured Roseovarius sp. TaxID=293344 RepID=UPI00261FC6C8|nr:LuxR C-terminal-related transcriptional regulator [uncultured Roseovarius sp.]
MTSTRRMTDQIDVVTLSDADRDAAIDRLYDVALDPARYEALLDHWESAIGPLRARVDLSMPHLLDDPQIAEHFRRATEFLDRLAPEETDNLGLDGMLVPFDRVPALLLDRCRHIRAANLAARQAMALPAKAELHDLPIHQADMDALRCALDILFDNREKDTAVLRVRAAQADHLIVFRLQRCIAADGTVLVLAASNAVSMPPGFCEILIQAFDLTQTEADILCHLVDCRSVSEIAAERGRSVDTVRAQIKSLLAKTETHSQLELVRLALSLIDMTAMTVRAAPGPHEVSKGYATLAERDFKSLVTPDGRRVDYLILGAPRGRPVLYLPLDFGLVRWPASAEACAALRGLKVIVPLRPGYGLSDMVDRSTDYDTALLDDSMRVLRAEGVGHCPILCLSGDAYYAVKLARANPFAFSGIIACSGMLPLTRREQFERMHKWHRFIMAGAKYTPHLLPFMVKAGFLLARKIGKRTFLHAVYGNSAADVATIEDPEAFEALATGSEVALSEHHSAHEAFSRQLISGQLEDWSADVEALRGKLPIVFINGTQDPQVPLATIDEFRRDYGWIEFHLIEDAGQLAFFRHWRIVLERLMPMLAD